MNTTMFTGFTGNTAERKPETHYLGLKAGHNPNELQTKYLIQTQWKYK